MLRGLALLHRVFGVDRRLGLAAERMVHRRSAVRRVALDIGSGAVWTLAGAAALAAFFVAEQCGVRWPHELTVAQARILEFVGLQGVLLTSYGFVHLLVRPHREAVRQVESLSEQLAGIEHDLAGAKQGAIFPGKIGSSSTSGDGNSNSCSTRPSWPGATGGRCRAAPRGGSDAGRGGMRGLPLGPVEGQMRRA